MQPSITPTAPESTRQRGNAAEDIAAHYLLQKGYRVIHRNLYTLYGEIDILTKDGEEYVCVEVRSRSKWRDDELSPEYCFSKVKYTHLVRSLISLAFLHNKPVRIDLVIVEGKKVRRHYKCIEI